VLLGALLRVWAAVLLPTDFDEPVYVRIAFDHARALRLGDLNGVIDYPENREHPALVKVLYGLVVLALGDAADSTTALYATRTLSVVLGTLAVLLVALAGGPLAGGMLAVHTLAVKYTSQAYLEALPHATSIVAVLAFQRAASARDRWFWLSALALGLTAAGKFTYLPVVVVIVYLATWEKNIQWRPMLAYFAAAAAVFWSFNPTLWRDPLPRLADALFFHARYAQSLPVQQSGYPWYQPVLWVSTSAASGWHPEVFFYFGFDGIIFLLAVAGLPREWRERRWLVVWMAACLLFLLLWPTKWPQYALVVVPALCLAAAPTAVRVYRRLRELEEYWQWLPQMLPRPPLLAWIALGAFVVFISAVYFTSAAQYVVGRIGWSRLTTEGSLLPSRTVYALVPGPEGQMILGTERGAVIWAPPTATDLPDHWTVFTTRNSGLPSDRVLALAQDAAGNVWFGTQSGLSRYDGRSWQTTRAAELGLAGDQVHALALGGEGQVWVGTQTGAAVWNGHRWTAYTTANSGLLDDHVFALAITPTANGDRVWFGTRTGVSRLDAATGAWDSFTSGDSDLGAGAVLDLMVDSSGWVWAGTVGGLSVWDGAGWRTYRTGNSGLPRNTVNAAFEPRPGVLWVGAAMPTEVGGALAAFDGQTWRTYRPQNSGFSGAEPLAFALDSQGRLWIGTRTAGVDIYQLPR
jgi:hypothetical protein